MYLTCSVTFEENTCILTFCMSFTRIPKESKIHLENISDTVHQDTCNLRASLVSHWIHIRIHQDTCILDSSSRYIRIHRDTKSRYMYLGRVMMTLQDTIRIHHDTCILDASSEPRWIHTRYARDTLQIHSGYVSLACSICPAAKGLPKDPCEIHAGYMYLQWFEDTCGIHAGYFQDTS